MRIYYTLIFTFVSLLAFSQDIKVTNDLLTWYGIGLRKEITKAIDFDLEKELRFNQNAGTLYKHLTTSKISYDVFKNIEFGVGIKFNRDKNKENIFEDKYTHLFELKYKHKVERFRLSNRFRYEQDNNKLLKLAPNKHSLRNRLKLDYKIKQSAFEPYMATELFYQKSTKNAAFEKIRFDLGTNFEINKRNEIKAYYRIERELIQDYPYTYYFFGLFYTHKL